MQMLTHVQASLVGRSEHQTSLVVNVKHTQFSSTSLLNFKTEGDSRRLALLTTNMTEMRVQNCVKCGIPALQKDQRYPPHFRPYRRRIRWALLCSQHYRLSIC